MKIARDGYPFIFGPFVPGAVLCGLYFGFRWLPFIVLGIILLVFSMACAFFFRNPARRIPDDNAALLSPADGRILQVIPVDDEFVGRGHRVDIFLSILDAHLNRVPASGKIEFVRHRPGKFISAFKDRASADNERTDLGISARRGNFRVAQIAGSIARRIVCHLKEHDQVSAGQVYGMIRFGSRTEITFPNDFEPCVRPGQHVRAGETIIGTLIENA